MSHPPESTAHGRTPRAQVRGLDAAGLLQSAVAPPFGAIAPLFPAYDLLATLGSGGAGTVYLARHRRLQREVAIKILHPHVHGDPDARERFRREALATARLQHPFIVGVLDVGDVEGVAYLVLEYCSGGTLRTLLGDAATRERALPVLAKVCEAVAYAHGQGAVHRDLKPENVLLDAHGHPRVADFGLARVAVPDTPTMTHTGTVMGTPHYMAPEQVEGRAADARADVYALGVMLYEALTGSVPVGRFAPPSARGSRRPDLDDLVLRALDADPERRPSAREVGAALVGAAKSAAPEALEEPGRDRPTTRLQELAPTARSLSAQVGAPSSTAARARPVVRVALQRVHIAPRLTCLLMLAFVLTLEWFRMSTGTSVDGWTARLDAPLLPSLPMWSWWLLLAVESAIAVGHARGLVPARPRWIPALTALSSFLCGAILVSLPAYGNVRDFTASNAPMWSRVSGELVPTSFALGGLCMIALALVLTHEWILAGAPGPALRTAQRRRLRATDGPERTSGTPT